MRAAPRENLPRAYTDSEDPVQLVHSCSLFRAYTVPEQNWILPNVWMERENPRWDFAHVQDDANPNILRIFEGTFRPVRYIAIFFVVRADRSVSVVRWSDNVAFYCEAQFAGRQIDFGFLSVNQRNLFIHFDLYWK